MYGISKSIQAETMLDYLQSMLTCFLSDREEFGSSDPRVKDYMREMLSCKNMVECLIGCPVNLGMNGKVTVGF